MEELGFFQEAHSYHPPIMPLSYSPSVGCILTGHFLAQPAPQLYPRLPPQMPHVLYRRCGEVAVQQISEAIGFLAMTLIRLTHSFNTTPLRYTNVQTTLPEIQKTNSPTQQFSE